MTKKIFAMFLAVLMVMSILPASAFAEGAHHQHCPGADVQHSKENCDYTLTGAKKEANCGFDGGDVAKCTTCNAEFLVNIVAANGHCVTKEVGPQSATCFRPGHNGGEECTICGRLYNVKYTAAPVLYLDESRTECDEYRYYAKDTLNTLVEGAQPGDCEAGENAIAACPICGDTKTTVLAANRVHSWTDWQLFKPATKDENGTAYRDCTICGKREINNNVYFDHEHVIVPVEAVEATCEKTGLQAHYVCLVYGCKQLYITKAEADKRHIKYEAMSVVSYKGVQYVPVKESDLIVYKALGHETRTAHCWEKNVPCQRCGELVETKNRELHKFETNAVFSCKNEAVQCIECKMWLSYGEDGILVEKDGGKYDNNLYKGHNFKADKNGNLFTCAKNSLTCTECNTAYTWEQLQQKNATGGYNITNSNATYAPHYVNSDWTCSGEDQQCQWCGEMIGVAAWKADRNYWKTLATCARAADTVNRQGKVDNVKVLTHTFDHPFKSNCEVQECKNCHRLFVGGELTGKGGEGHKDALCGATKLPEGILVAKKDPCTKESDLVNINGKHEHAWNEAITCENYLSVWCTIENCVCRYLDDANIHWYGGEQPAHDWGGWTITKKPNCLTPGSKKRECKVCHKVEIESLKALGHEEWTITVPADCLTGSYTYTICLREDCPLKYNYELKGQKNDPAMVDGREYNLYGDYLSCVKNNTTYYFDGTFGVNGNMNFTTDRSKAVIVWREGEVATDYDFYFWSKTSDHKISLKECGFRYEVLKEDYRHFAMDGVRVVKMEVTGEAVKDAHQWIFHNYYGETCIDKAHVVYQCKVCESYRKLYIEDLPADCRDTAKLMSAGSIYNNKVFNTVENGGKMVANKTVRENGHSFPKTYAEYLADVKNNKDVKYRKLTQADLDLIKKYFPNETFAEKDSTCKDAEYPEHGYIYVMCLNTCYKMDSNGKLVAYTCNKVVRIEKPYAECEPFEKELLDHDNQAITEPWQCRWCHKVYSEPRTWHDGDKDHGDFMTIGKNEVYLYDSFAYANNAAKKFGHEGHLDETKSEVVREGNCYQAEIRRTQCAECKEWVYYIVNKDANGNLFGQHVITSVKTGTENGLSVGDALNKNNYHKDATCTNEGYTYYIGCDRCKTAWKENYLPFGDRATNKNNDTNKANQVDYALAGTYIATAKKPHNVVNDNSTCMKGEPKLDPNGNLYWESNNAKHCQACTWSENDGAWMKKHPVSDDKICKEYGYVEYYCVPCGKIHLYNFVGNLGAYYVSNEGVTDKNATCAQGGVKNEHCFFCNETRVTYVPNKPHVNADGHWFYACKNDKFGNPENKDFQDYIEDWLPDGYTVKLDKTKTKAYIINAQDLVVKEIDRVCKNNCRSYRYDNPASKENNTCGMTEVGQYYRVEKFDATCTKPGYTVNYCACCGENIVIDKTQPALGHTIHEAAKDNGGNYIRFTDRVYVRGADGKLYEYYEYTPATNTSEGSYYVWCDRCGERVEGTIPMLTGLNLSISNAQGTDLSGEFTSGSEIRVAITADNMNTAINMLKLTLNYDKDRLAFAGVNLYNNEHIKTNKFNIAPKKISAAENQDGTVELIFTAKSLTEDEKLEGNVVLGYIYFMVKPDAEFENNEVIEFWMSDLECNDAQKNPVTLECNHSEYNKVKATLRELLNTGKYGEDNAEFVPGLANIQDAIAMMQGKHEYGLTYDVTVDINDNGRIDAEDIALIYQLYTGDLNANEILFARLFAQGRYDLIEAIGGSVYKCDCNHCDYKSLEDFNYCPECGHEQH